MCANMKRLSKKLRKRLSSSSREDTKQQEDHVYKGVEVARDEGFLPGNGRESRPLPSNGVSSEIMLFNGPAEGPTQEDEENHDYSTLDGDEDVTVNAATNNAVTAQQQTLAALLPPRRPCATDSNSDCTNGTPTSNPPRKNGLRSRTESTEANNISYTSRPLMEEFHKLARKGWYWGPMTREQAEKKLSNLPEASFLVRDSSDDRYLLSLSFRSNNKTLHTRIEHSGMKFSFYEDSPKQSYTSVIELIESSVRDSTEQGVFCYSRSRHPHAQTFPVRLVHPVSRFTEVRPLQDLCRFVIRQYTRIDHIQNLPLPKQIKGYLNQSYF